MPIDAAGVFTFRDNEYTIGQVLTAANLNRLRADVKNGFDAKMQRPAKPWVKGNILWYNGTDWVALAPGSVNQALQYVAATNTLQWATVSLTGEAFTFTGTAAEGDMLYYNGVSWHLLNRGSANQVFSLDSDLEPYWRNLTEGFSYSGTAVRGDILYYGDSSQWRLLSKGTSGQILEMSANDPVWRDKYTAGSHVVMHTTAGTFGSNDWAFDITTMYTISGTNIDPLDDKAKEYNIGTLTFTPSSSTSKIYLTGIIDWAQQDNRGPGYCPFFILDSAAVNFSNIVADNLTLINLDHDDQTSMFSHSVYYHYTISSSTEKTVKLYMGANNFDGRLRISNWYIEAMEIY